jgi:hypothetical protein
MTLGVFPGPSDVRPVLLNPAAAAPVDFYVATTGSNTTGNGSIGAPWLTTEFACQYIRQNYNTAVTKKGSNGTININVAAGTYTDKVHLEYLFDVNIVGAGVTTIFDATHNGIFNSFAPCMVGLSSVKIQNTGSPGTGVGVYSNSVGACIFVAAINFGAGLARHMVAEAQGSVVMSGAGASCTISGGAGNFAFCGSYGFIDITGGPTITLTGTPAFSDCFAWAAGGTIFVESNTTFTGAATGKRFRVENGGLIATGDGTLTSTAGLTFLPGDVAGDGFSFGAYDNYVFGTNLSDVPNTQTGATYTVVNTDTNIIADRAGTVTLTLPDPTIWSGRRLLVKTIQNQTVVSASGNVVPRAGGGAGTAILGGTAGLWAEMYSDATNWVIMAGN